MGMFFMSHKPETLHRFVRTAMRKQGFEPTVAGSHMAEATRGSGLDVEKIEVMLDPQQEGTLMQVTVFGTSPARARELLAGFMAEVKREAGEESPPVSPQPQRQAPPRQRRHRS